MKFVKLSKKLIILLTIAIVFVRIFSPVLALADDPTITPTDTPVVTPTDTPTPTDTTTPTPTVTNSPTPTDTPTPTIDPSVTTDPSLVTPTPTQDPTIVSTNSADVTNTATSSADSGNNTVTSGNIASPTPSDSPVPTSTVTTGNAVNTTTVQNTVNTQEVNSQIEYQTINLFFDSNGSIDLTSSIQQAETVAANSANPTSNILVTSGNYATLANNVVSSADTGNNSASGKDNMIINTGNAYSLVSLLNSVNMTLVNSTIHIITINIYGTLNGNIILPQLNSQTSCSSCTISVTNNQATVTNTVSSSATTGENSITASTSGAITTGNAQNAVDMVNILNTLIGNSLIGHLYVNNLGLWNGNFLGWDTANAQTYGNVLSIQDSPSGSGNQLNGLTVASSNNSATVNNTVVSSANTGNNTAAGNQATISTGNAYNVVGITNFINSIFLNSTGFFGFINIFGTLNGNIGGANYFVTPTPTPDVQEQVVTSQTTDNHKSDGGLLWITTSNNVNGFVYPGDTVTTFATIRNPGVGTVYGTTLHLQLLHSGNVVGSADFNLGDISANHGVKFNTGLALSKSAPAGEYTISLSITGTTGDANTPVSTSGYSTFSVYGSPVGEFTQNTTLVQAATTQNKAVLGAHTKSPSPSNNDLLFVLIGIVATYLLFRGLRQRKQLIGVFQQKAPFKARLNSLRLFLL